jgi:hypothetical protein
VWLHLLLLLLLVVEGLGAPACVFRPCLLLVLSAALSAVAAAAALASVCGAYDASHVQQAC